MKQWEEVLRQKLYGLSRKSSSGRERHGAKKAWKKTLSVLLSLVMATSLLPATAFEARATEEEGGSSSASATYLIPDYVDSHDVTKGITGFETRPIPTGTEPVKSNYHQSWGVATKTTYYKAEGTITIDGGVTVQGDVRLILMDGCSLTVNGKSETDTLGGALPASAVAVMATS